MIMRKFLFVLALTAVLGVNAQENVPKEVNVTVYNDNLGVISEKRDIDIKQGTSEIRITNVAALIDPTSVSIKLNGKVLEQNYQYDLANYQSILARYIDNEITLIGETVITGKLLSVSGNNIVLQNKDGGLIMLPKYDDYRISVGSLPDGLITRPTLKWLVDSKNAGNQKVELSYQTDGMNWHAEYVAVLDEKDKFADLNAWVSIENRSGTGYKDANIKLVAGDVNRVQDVVIRGSRGYNMKMVNESSDAQQFEERAFFEYHLYELQRPATISNNEVKQISLFESPGVSVTKKYLFRSAGYWGYSDGTPQEVSVAIELENKKDNKLGIPMPKGKVRLYKKDGNSVQFIGEDLIDHTPKDEKIKLKVGEAFDILAEEEEVDRKQISDKVREVSYQIKIKNRKSEDISVDVEKVLGQSWEILSESIKSSKLNSSTIQYNVPVRKNSETIIDLKIRFGW
jgi:hypothetical protein